MRVLLVLCLSLTPDHWFDKLTMTEGRELLPT